MNKTMSVYARWAPSYDHSPNATRDADRAVMQRLCPRFAALDVLEFGCGTGKNTQQFAGVARRVLGVDISAEMLAVAHARPLPPSVCLVQIAPGARWPTPDASVDVVTASLVLEHIEMLSPVFAEAARVLRAGGWFWISELHPFRQWQGSTARFDDAEGCRHVPDCFVHGFGTYVRAALGHGFQLCEVEEPMGNGQPRLLVMGFRFAEVDTNGS